MAGARGGTVDAATVHLAEIVDSHVHHWDPARTDLYPVLLPEAAIPEMGDITGMKRLYDQATHLAEAGPWPVTSYVHISAGVAPGLHLAETELMQQLADRTGNPAAIIGTVDPHASLSEIADDLDRLLASRNFRGIRILEGVEYGTAPARELLGLLAERDLVYDLVVHPDQMLVAAGDLDAVPGLQVVVEHAGWPARPGDPEEFAVWRAGTVALGRRDATAVKFSGLAMTMHEFSVPRMQPYFDHCLEAFGAQRCMFGSNFPVDGLFGTQEELWATYLRLAQPLGAEAVAQLFAGTARRVYRTQPEDDS